MLEYVLLCKNLGVVWCDLCPVLPVTLNVVAVFDCHFINININIVFTNINFSVNYGVFGL